MSGQVRWEGERVRNVLPAPPIRETVPGLFWCAVERWSDREALIIRDRRGRLAVTYRQLGDLAARFAGHLAGLGLGRGTRVSLLLPNSLEFAVAYFGGLHAGAVVNPINTRLAPPEIAFILNDLGSQCLVAHEQVAGPIYELWERGELPALEHFVWVGDGVPGRARSWDDALARAVPLPVAAAPSDPSALAVVMYTSGTTGRPKGAMMAHRQIVFNCHSCQWAFGYREGERQLVAVPLFHVTGLNSQLVAGLASGGTLVVLGEYTRAGALAALVEERVNIFVGVPTMFTLLLITEGLDRADLGALRMCAYAGAPMPVDTIRRLKERFPGVRCVNFYGLTETSSITTAHPDEQALERPASVGLPAPGTELMVVGPDGTPLGPGATGELWIRGGQVVLGYWQRPEQTAETITGGWLHTGDVARIDAEGYVYILDRMKDVINRGGEKVYAIEVENVLCNHPAVLEAAVVGVPDPIFGEAVKACVVLRPGASATAGELQEWVRRHLADYKVPRDVEFLEALPRNANGKVLKRELRAAAVSRS